MASGASLDRHFPVKHATGRQNKTPEKLRSEEQKQQACAFGKTSNQRPFLQNKRSFCKPETGAVFGSKRRYSHSSSMEQRPFKRRRRDIMIPPTKFLLGGNINDPLNLESLADEEINRKMNEVTPYSSPLPAPRHQEQIEVLIPQNINDPLNLNSGEDIEFKLMSPKSKRKKKHNKKKKNQLLDSIETCDEKEPSENKVVGIIPPKSAEKPIEKPLEKKPVDKKSMDKIVSPVVPQGESSKFARRNRTRSFSHSDEKGKGQYKKRKRNSSINKNPRFRPKDEAFQYGNYDRYYGYRNINATKDSRLQSFKREWFISKDVLDIGCNVGHLTLTVARDFHPKKLIGIDIDDKLVKMAQRNVQHYLTNRGSQEFPISMALCHGPIAVTALPLRADHSANFPNNVFFVTGNYVPESDALLELQRPEFDTILCLSLTKWIHLNWGDDGLKRMFRRIFLQLRPGGKLILESQLWPSYAKKKKLTERTYQNYNSIQFKPDQFNEYLLGKDVGFSTCELITTPAHPSRGFCRPMYVFTKSECSVEEDYSLRVSPTEKD